MKQIISYFIHLSNNLLNSKLCLEENTSAYSENSITLYQSEKDKEIVFLRLIIAWLIQFIANHKSFLPSNKQDVYSSDSEPYRGLTVDSPPVISDDLYSLRAEARQILTFEELRKEHLTRTGRELKPVSSRKPSQLNYKGVCPICGAPHNYLYENNVARRQLLCKACKHTFIIHNSHLDKVHLRCPYCLRALDHIKDRSNFKVFKCRNDVCPFYLNNLEMMSAEQKHKFQKNSQDFKVRYIFRAFDLELPQLQEECLKQLNSPLDLSRIRHSSHVLGLVLTYYVNYGLSSRKTASIMKDIHQVKISHQTIVNYAQAAAKVVQPFVERYPYELTQDLCGDETYIKVKGRKHYIFFISDKTKKIITSYQAFKNRDTPAAIQSIYQTLLKYPEFPDKLKLVVDGNPIYQLAHLYFSLQHIPFELIQVIGLQNKTETARLFRPYKQVTERLNRTFKSDYLTMNGFKSLDSANGYLILFTACFNFLRPHQSLGFKVPVPIPELEECPHMPAKWLKLIEMSYAQIS